VIRSPFNLVQRLVLIVAAVVISSGCRPPSTPPPRSAADRSHTTDTIGEPPIMDVDSNTAAALAAETVSVDPAMPAVASRASTADSIAAPLRLVPVEIALPAPAFRGTPVPRNEPFVEEPAGKPRAPFLAPEGTVNLALGKRVTCSDLAPSAGEVDFVTNGEKEASDFAILELAPGTQWVQIDLDQRATIYAIVVWHQHAEARVYRDVVVQVSDDPDFLEAVTVFNNDYDNSSGLGIGTALGYVETSEGRLIDCRGVEGRYVRLYSRGNHLDDKNHYTQVDVYGRS
jgi:hypothetical protein